MKTFRGLFLTLTLIMLTTITWGQTPFGTLKVKNADNLYIDRREITNFDWLEYLYYLQREYGANSPQYLAALPDTTLTSSQNKLSIYRHPAYCRYPIVGITYAQATDYAQWRTMVANMHLDLKRKKYRFEYQLASEEVLQQAFLQQKNKSVPTHELQAISLSSNKLVNIDDNAKEITSNGTFVTGADNDKLIFEAYQHPDSLTSFRCMAKVVK